jgi:hydrogenase maturation protease
MSERLAVFACGNPSRGDDALGLELLERVAAAQFPGVVTVEDFQFQIEHVLDMERAVLTLFLDAGTEALAPISFFEVSARAAPATPSTHALEPADLLAVYVRALGKPPPPTFVLCVRGENFALGEGMTAPARRRLEVAWPFLRDLCADPEATRWRGLVPTFDVD